MLAAFCQGDEMLEAVREQDRVAGPTDRSFERLLWRTSRPCSPTTTGTATASAFSPVASISASAAASAGTGPVRRARRRTPAGGRAWGAPPPGAPCGLDGLGSIVVAGARCALTSSAADFGLARATVGPDQVRFWPPSVASISYSALGRREVDRLVLLLRRARLDHRGVEVDLVAQAEQHRVARPDLGLFQWVRSRTALTVVLVVPSSLQICWSVSSGWWRSSQAIASGRSWRLDKGV